MKAAASTMLAIAAISGTAFAQSTPSGDAKAGQEKTAMCIGCHGIQGWRTAYPEIYHVPMISGQHQAYLVKALQSYRTGERSHPSMRAIAATLSDQDIANLAAYYGAPGAPAGATPAAAPPPAAAATPAPAAPATPVKK